MQFSCKEKVGGSSPLAGFYMIDFDMLPLTAKRKFLFEEAKYACTLCSFSKRRHDGGSILEIDHIDGNSKNNTKNNLRVLCPNCHALTHNFRNWGRKGKTSPRLRKGNIIYDTIRAKIKQEEQAYQQHFCDIVKKTFDLKEIDYSKLGWLEKLAKLLEAGPQVTCRRFKRWMPEFYWKNCFRKGPARKVI